MKNETARLSSIQDQYVLDAVAETRKLVIYKLSSSHRDSVEDIIHRIFCKIWVWKIRHNKSLEFEEWRKVTRKVTYSEIAEYFSEKYTRDVVFSQADIHLQETISNLPSSHSLLEGNSKAEIESVLLLIWKAAQILSLRQKYAFFLQSEDFLFEFINSGCCSTKELSVFFDLEEDETIRILKFVPLTDEKISTLLTAKLNEKLSLQQVWEAKTKARVNLFKTLKNLNKRTSE